MLDYFHKDTYFLRGFVIDAKLGLDFNDTISMFAFGSYVHDVLDVQKVLFMDSAEGVANTLRPYWSEATGDRANVVQAQPDMLEIVPPGTSKGSGVKLLLDHLGVSPKEVRTKEVVFLLF